MAGVECATATSGHLFIGLPAVSARLHETKPTTASSVGQRGSVTAVTKVFWSWQSDRPGKTGRHFVRAAIQEAIDAILAEGQIEESQRDLHLDYDRKGASGSPDLARLILDKIKESTIFIADVTRIGQSDQIGDDGKDQSQINPNVAIDI